jgi:hypothetical protein
VRHTQRHRRHLLHQQHRDSLGVKLLDRLGHLLHQQRRQPHRRLVQQQHLRARHQPARDRQHLLLAAGERARRLVLALSQNRETVQFTLQQV